VRAETTSMSGDRRVFVEDAAESVVTSARTWSRSTGSGRARSGAAAASGSARKGEPVVTASLFGQAEDGLGCSVVVDTTVDRAGAFCRLVRTAGAAISFVTMTSRGRVDRRVPQHQRARTGAGTKASQRVYSSDRTLSMPLRCAGPNRLASLAAVRLDATGAPVSNPLPASTRTRSSPARQVMSSSTAASPAHPVSVVSGDGAGDGTHSTGRTKARG